MNTDKDRILNRIKQRERSQAGPGTNMGKPNWLATDETQIKHGCRKQGLIRKAGWEESRNGKDEMLTTDGHQ